ncbi:ComEC family competence protein [mine drainage metagenome]|uniref:ComEC family competence protein n=1 Tax=mine drainage metagenome TaxID=410659 RepID=A0A1J5SWA0_9ZZZZ
MLRLLLPLIAGILVQYYLDINFIIILVVFAVAIIFFLAVNLLNASLKFKLAWLTGICISLIFITTGSTLSYVKNADHKKNNIAKNYTNNAFVIATIQESLIEKTKSFKALGKAESVISNQTNPVKGNILLYFKKDSSKTLLHYGSRIIIHKSLQPIVNAGNPGSFNYKRFCAFQDIYYQVFLNRNDYQILSSENKFFFDDWLQTTRTKVLTVLRQYISNPDAASIAEALLIGYRDDLDKDLVQAYSNTGVVHIIAISGLHIAMIYGLLIFLFRPFNRFGFIKWIRPFVVLIIIWGFTFVAGAVPSILRSAVMFSFIVIGESFSKRINIYNNLAASAFTILLFNPFSLWDVGFQLSYAAVLSIVIFSKHINNWVYFKNKILKYVWELSSVTISAQILTLPLILFYFHQFPGLFLFTNLIAVPLSGLILFIELLLLIVSPLAVTANFVGHATEILISWMNNFILHINSIPFSTWPSLQINIIQTILLYLLIIGLANWLMHKQPKSMIFALSYSLLFFMMRSSDFIKHNQQQKLIVYNVPQHQAIDLIAGRNYQFVGDSILLQDEFLQNFHLKPSRIQHRITAADQLATINYSNNLICSSNKKIVLIDDAINPSDVDKKIKADAIIISQNPKLNINQLAKAFDCNQYIFDASNPLWKIKKWKKDCENLHLRHYSIPEQGAFVMEL